MRKYWRCVFGSACVLGGCMGSVKYVFAQEGVVGALDRHTFTAVDPMNAVIAAGVMLGIGIFAYMKRHKKDR